MKLKEVDIPDELIDFFMEHELINSYKNIQNDLKTNKFFHPDDKPYMEEVFAALKIIGGYYVHNFDKKVKKK